jgi:hypothetical protein
MIVQFMTMQASQNTRAALAANGFKSRGNPQAIGKPAENSVTAIKPALSATHVWASEVKRHAYQRPTAPTNAIDKRLGNPTTQATKRTCQRALARSSPVIDAGLIGRAGAAAGSGSPKLRVTLLLIQPSIARLRF